jgi:hypothetical protein
MELLRRQFIEWLGLFGLTGALSNTTLALVSTPSVENQEYLHQASLHLDEAIQHYRDYNHIRCQLILDAHLPSLKRLANAASDYQPFAATLTLRALILSIELATRDRLFSNRELLAIEATKYAALTCDASLLALASYWHADTFVYCLRQPERAVHLLTTALKHANHGQSSLIKVGIALNLAIANAQLGNERGVMDNIQLAYNSKPNHPDRDSHANFTFLRQSELFRMESSAYSELARFIPSYGATAFERACSSLVSTPSTSGYHSLALIQMGEAAIFVDDKPTFENCLYDSLGVARTYNRVAQIDSVAQLVPDSWKSETSFLKLQSDISHHLLVTRR